MGKCRNCNTTHVTISDTIGLCVNCIRGGVKLPRDLHGESRVKFKLPTWRELREGLKCTICGRRCLIPLNSRGFCGYRLHREGRMAVITGSAEGAVGLFYYDPHPTNCVALPVCPAAKGLGYPDYALSPKGERGYYNIAVFYGGCNLDCLYCQNWEYREMSYKARPLLTLNDLVSAVNSRTTCVCHFGGDPGPFAPHAITASRRMFERAREIGLRVFRVCWETNGLWNPILLEKATQLSLETGGIVKIDFKAWSFEVYEALCGVEERHVRVIRENIKLVAKYMKSRRAPPILVTSTLLVPGYIDDYEIDQMTKYVASIDPEIPYIFLGFRPDYMLLDLPTTSWNHANNAIKIARENGLRNVWVENVFLLGHAY